MIVATHKCGCPPKEEKPPCSPCCVSGKKVRIHTPVLADHSEGPCCKKQRLHSTISLPKIEPPPCCPTKPDDSSVFDSRKVRSEIAERRLPYKELEAVINNNRLVIRTQKEAPRVEYDPPCDCIEDSQPPVQDETQHQVQNSGNRTVTLFPRPQSPASNLEETETEDKEEEVRTIEREENPNIFLLRVRRKGKDGDNIDLEFKTPRPWSLQKRLEYSQRIQPPRPVTVECNDMIPENKERKRNASHRGKKRKRK